MDLERARERRREIGGYLLIAWLIAISPNTLEAFGVAPDGWAWSALRFGFTAVFTVYLIAFLVAIVREVRARRAA